MNSTQNNDNLKKSGLKNGQLDSLPIPRGLD